MNRVFLIRALVTILLLLPVQVKTAPASKLKIERGRGSAIKLSIPTERGSRYQLLSSPDLKRWIPEGSAVSGDGKELSVEHDTSNTKTKFLRMSVAIEGPPVNLAIKPPEIERVKLVFMAHAGRQYHALATSDFIHWDPITDLITGAGENVTIEYDTRSDVRLFVRIDDVIVEPISDMARIPAGTFTMGSAKTEKGRDLDEDPLTEVVFVQGFWMGKHEVTQREYQELMGDNPSWFKGNLDHPVEQVSWDEAVSYCALLTQVERAAGRIPATFFYRLPTEAEFEYASRGGTRGRFHFGDDPEAKELDQYAWYDGNSTKTSHPVGQKKPNPFGLYDINGNVWEWCSDWYSPAYAGGTVYHPIGAVSGKTRVFRGGGWDYTADACRSAFRNHVAPTRRAKYLGFRIVLSAVL